MRHFYDVVTWRHVSGAADDVAATPHSIRLPASDGVDAIRVSLRVKLLLPEA